MSEALKPYRRDWSDEAEHLIRRLRARGPYKPLRKPGCYRADSLDLVTRDFHFQGKGRDVIVRVRLARVVFVHLLRAMIEAPTIQLWGPLSSYRSCATQRVLYERYLSGGPLAARPGSSYHNAARSIDGYRLSLKERRALAKQDFEDLLPQDPPHMTYRARG